MDHCLLRARIASFVTAALLILTAASTPAHGFGKKRQNPVPGPTPPVTPIPDPDVPAHGTFTLRVMAYNIHGLPDPVPGVDHSRHIDIGLMLRDMRAAGVAPHVVAIQEAFSSKTMSVVTLAGYPYVKFGAQRKFPYATGSGLVILSEFPISDSATIDYSSCGGSDCLSRKGAQFVRVVIPDIPTPVDVFNTHMNAHYKNFYPLYSHGEQIRLKQLPVLGTLLKYGRRSDVPAIALGDFNIKRRYSTYPALIATSTGMSNAGDICVILRDCTGDGNTREYYDNTVDHHLYTPTAVTEDGPIHMTPVHFETHFRDPVNGRQLSDHYALEVHYQLEW